MNEKEDNEITVFIKDYLVDCLAIIKKIGVLLVTVSIPLLLITLFSYLMFIGGFLGIVGIIGVVCLLILISEAIQKIYNSLSSGKYPKGLNKNDLIFLYFGCVNIFLIGLNFSVFYKFGPSISLKMIGPSLSLFILLNPLAFCALMDGQKKHKG